MNGNTDHNGAFERRFQSQMNGELDPHRPNSNGSYGSHSFIGGSVNGNAFDGSSHSPRTHSNESNQQHSSGALIHSSTPKDSENQGSELIDLVEQDRAMEDVNDSANHSKNFQCLCILFIYLLLLFYVGKPAGFTSMDSWTPSLLINPEVSLLK